MFLGSANNNASNEHSSTQLRVLSAMKVILWTLLFLSPGTSSVTFAPSALPSPVPTPDPTATYAPTVSPTMDPSSSFPTLSPTMAPTITRAPTWPPSFFPTDSPSLSPTLAPTYPPSLPPTDTPSLPPTLAPTAAIKLQSGLGRWTGHTPLAAWSFSREDCLTGSFPNDIVDPAGGKGVFGRMVRNGSLGSSSSDGALTACLEGNGVRVLPDLPQDAGVALASSGTLGTLQALAPLQGLTFELWGSFNKTDDLDRAGSNTFFNEYRPLLMFGEDNDDLNPETSFAHACDSTPAFDLAVFSKETELEFLAPRVSVNDDDETCLTTADTPLPFRAASHIVAVFDGLDLGVYLDGALALTAADFLLDGGNSDMAFRSTSFHEYFRLQLLSGASVLENSLQPLAASLYFTAVFGVPLNASAVLQNFNAGLPNSRPVVLDQNVTVVEDGEPWCGALGLSHPHVYRREFEPVGLLGIVWLRVVDSDNDPAHPNYDARLAREHPTLVKVTELPSRGTLYQALPNKEGGHEAITLAGTVLRTGSDAANFSVPVYYRPPKDEHSSLAGTGQLGEFDRFSISAVDGVSGLPSQYPSSADVLVHVSPCNDPPIALNATVVAPSATLTSVLLNGTDVDSGTFVGATITRLPSQPGGLLRHWDSSTQQYANITRVPFVLNPYFASLSASHGAQLQYAFYGSEASPPLDKFGTFAVDTFEFSVTDSGGASSSPATAQVLVRLPLVAQVSSAGYVGAYSSSSAAVVTDDAAVAVATDPSSDPHSKLYTVFEATMGNVSVFASDVSDLKRPVAVRLVSSPTHGQLVDPSNGHALANGSLLSSVSSWPYTKPLLFTYLGAQGYFNSPLTRYNGSLLAYSDENNKGDQVGSSDGLFDDDDVDSRTGYGAADTFRFRTELAGDSAVFSLPSRQAVVVVNVNDAPTLTGPPAGTKLRVQAIGASSSTNNNQLRDGSSKQNEGDGGGDADSLVIRSIKLTDSDRDVDPVKVQVTCKYGFLTLRKSALKDVDFNSFDMCYGHADWSCAGDGAGDRSMLFVGQPSAVANALGRITYQSTYNLVTDELTVSVFDGQRPATGPGSGSFGAEADGSSSCLEKRDFTSVSRRGVGRYQTECFTATLNVSIEVGTFAGSDSTVAEPQLTDNTQLGVAGAFFGLLVLCFVARLGVSRLLGWRLRGIPSDWDSDEEDDDDADADDDDSSSEEDERRNSEEDAERLTRRKSKAVRRLTLANKHVAGGRGFLRNVFGGKQGGRRGGAGGSGEGDESGGGGEGGGRRVDLRPSVAMATKVETEELRKGGAGGPTSPHAMASDVGTGNAAAAAAAAAHRFVPSDWRRHMDDDGHSYFSHPKSGVCTYAMPWVLTATDLAANIHETNDPMFWRAVETGRTRADGCPIVLYYNTVTRQSTFDAPMFATWKAEEEQLKTKRQRARVRAKK